jgi:hypothetical protein
MAALPVMGFAGSGTLWPAIGWRFIQIAVKYSKLGDEPRQAIDANESFCPVPHEIVVQFDHDDEPSIR